MIAEEMQVHAYLAFAPNHIYLKSYCQELGWYNTELTSREFPRDAWIMASGYITRTAIVHGIYMDTLSLQQSIAVCMNDLAKGYERRFGTTDGRFMMKCLETSLTYYPNNINALLMKAKLLRRNVKEQPANRELYSQMETAYLDIYDLGYREMPEKMYREWMGSLQRKEAYQSRSINTIFDRSNHSKGR